MVEVNYKTTYSSSDINAYCLLTATIGERCYDLAASVGARDSYVGIVTASGTGVSQSMVSAWYEDPSDFATVPLEHREEVDEALQRAAWRLWQEAKLVH